MIWTEEAVAQLCELWASGMSCIAIAREMGAGPLTVVTKNSIIGKVHRLGLAPRRLMPGRIARRPVPVAAIMAASVDATIALTHRHCRWPIGDPLLSDFRYCGALPRHNGPYCEAHWLVAYRPAPARRVPGQRVAAGEQVAV